MQSLLILGIILLAVWGFGIWERERRAYFMRDWVHVPLLAAIVVLLMALGSALRG